MKDTFDDIASSVYDDLQFIIDSDIVSPYTKGYLLGIFSSLGIHEV